VLPAFAGLISQIDRSLGHGAALVKAILRKSPEWTLVKIAHPNEFTSADVNSKQVPIPNIHTLGNYFGGCSSPFNQPVI
jgi:hypothetical protein